MVGSYVTIDLAARVKAAHDGARLSWRIGGATAMASGTWAMHYTGMLALRLPVQILFDWPTSLLSFLPSHLASAVALVVVKYQACVHSVARGQRVDAEGIRRFQLFGENKPGHL